MNFKEAAEKEVEKTEEYCPSSPVSLLGPEDIAPPKQARNRRRRKKGLPKYVKHRELREMEMESLTPRQFMMVTKQQSKDTETPFSTKKEDFTFFSSLLNAEKRARRKEPLKEILPLKKARAPSNTAKNTRRLEKAKDSANSALQRAPKQDLLPNPQMPSQAALPHVQTSRKHPEIPFGTYQELSRRIEEELAVHGCGVKVFLQTMKKQIEKISKNEEYKHLDNPADLKKSAIVFLNITQNRGACCKVTNYD